MVCVQDNLTSIWVSMRGVIVKCNRDRVRLATDSDWLGAELIRVLSADAKQHVERTGQRGFVDATREEGPDEDSEHDAAPPPDMPPPDSEWHQASTVFADAGGNPPTLFGNGGIHGIAPP